MGKVGGSLKLKLKQKEKEKQPQANVLKPKINTETFQSTKVKLTNQKTPAQLTFEAAQKKKLQEKLPTLASKSHKDKVAEFNEYLGKLSEHHDIPKVGPG